MFQQNFIEAGKWALSVGVGPKQWSLEHQGSSSIFFKVFTMGNPVLEPDLVFCHVLTAVILPARP